MRFIVTYVTIFRPTEYRPTFSVNATRESKDQIGYGLSAPRLYAFYYMYSISLSCFCTCKLKCKNLDRPGNEGNIAMTKF